jgi:hypothetical protein
MILVLTRHCMEHVVCMYKRTQDRKKHKREKTKKEKNEGEKARNKK